jgi:hypothetical protein
VVLCEGMFCTDSWSWVEITHLCHPLHNIPIRSIFPTPTQPISFPNLSSPPPPASHEQGRQRRPSLRRPAGRTAGDTKDESSVAPSAFSSQFRVSSWPFPSSSSNPRRLGWQWRGGRWRRAAKQGSWRSLVGFICSVFTRI